MTHESYEDLLYDVRYCGNPKTDRTDTGTNSLFGAQLCYDLRKGFPLITTKFVSFKLVAAELLWILSGSTNVKDLQAMGCHIWDEWAREDGSLGPVYGSQWRSWRSADGTTIDQLANVIESIKRDPDGRRHIVSAWNVGELHEMALPPCHAFFQFYVSDGKLSCQLYQRSADMFLGVPFNIASYALLTHIIAQQCDLDVGEFIWTGGDCHVYTNHFAQVDEQLAREPRAFPTLVVASNAADIDGYRLDEFTVIGYDPHPAIKASVAV